MKRYIVAILFVITVTIAIWFTSSTITPQTMTVGILTFGNTNLTTVEGFKAGLKDLGYIDGDNIRYIENAETRDKNQLAKYMQDLLDAKPDLVFTCATLATLTAKKMTAGMDVPVVFAPVNDPVATGVLTNIRAPEANMTGVRLSRSDGKRLQSLLEVAPSVKRVFVPYNPKDKSALATLDQLREALPKLDVELVIKTFHRGIDITKDTSYIPQDIDAILLPREGLVMSYNKEFVAETIQRKLPMSVPRFQLVEQGALTGYGFMGLEIGRQAARMAHLILSGSPVSGVPVETARDYLFINLDTAKKIGMTIPDAALRRAHHIIR